MAHPFRFGLQRQGALPGMTWADTAKRTEDAGFDTLFTPDHFSEQLAPIAALATAAAVTTDLKVGALVFGNDYRHPVILAKEMATLDVLSNGRVELGVGAGWMRTDYEAAGIDYDRPGVRIERLVESIECLRGLMGSEPFSFSGEHYTFAEYDGLPKPTRPLPLLIGGGGERMLGVAARHADIVGITANLRAGEVGVDAIADSAPEAYDQKLEWVKAAAGDRFADIELSSLTMNLTITDDRDGAVALMAELFSMPAETILDVPALLLGTVDQIVETLQERRERWGFNYPVLQGDDIDGMAQIVERLAGT